MLFAFALAYTTCILLSLAMNRHFQQVWPKQTLSPRITTLLRNGGWLLLILTLVYCAKLEGIAVGLVLALGLFSAAACILSLLLHYAPRMALGLVVAVPLAGLL
jgi:flagellar biosynthesis protein FliQ